MIFATTLFLNDSRIGNILVTKFISVVSLILIIWIKWKTFLNTLLAFSITVCSTRIYWIIILATCYLVALMSCATFRQLRDRTFSNIIICMRSNIFAQQTLTPSSASAATSSPAAPAAPAALYVRWVEFDFYGKQRWHRRYK